jgi:hypothetical protein
VSLVAASAELGQDHKILDAVWEEVRARWQDAAAADFEGRHWTPLCDQVVAAADAMDRLAPVLERMYRECSQGP